jgi:hypothetical protein
MGNTELRAELYFYTYWGGAFLSQIAEVWMIVQIGCELAGVSSRIRSWIQNGVPALAVFQMAASLLLCINSPVSQSGKVTGIILNLERSVSLAWLGTFLVACAAAEILGIEWAPGVREVSIGFAVEAIAATFASWLIDLLPDITWLSDIRETIYILALSVWALAILGKNYKTTILPETLNRFKSSFDLYAAAIERIKDSKL